MRFLLPVLACLIAAQPGYAADPAASKSKPAAQTTKKPAAAETKTATKPPAAKAHAIPAPPKPKAKPAATASKGPGRPPSHFATSTLSEADRTLATAALAAVEAGRYDEARQTAQRAKSEILLKIVTWLWLQRPGNGAPFEEIAAFVEKHADWPARGTLLRRVEEALVNDGSVPDVRAVTWFADHEATTGEGKLRLAEALLRLGRTEEAQQKLRDAWATGNFSQAQESEILRKYDYTLMIADHQARLDRLLWDRQADPARRMMRKVNDDWKSLAEARLALILRAGNLDRIIAAVPAHLQNDPGLAYERLRYQRERGNGGVEDIDSVLIAAPADAKHAEKWWTEQHIRARNALALGRGADAYRLVANHGPLDNRSMVEAEWLAGWIALRFTFDAERAARHFVNVFEIARFPVSRARAAYWIGRAAETMNDPERAKEWYEEAARHPATYYGQLALARTGRPAALPLPTDPQPTAAQIEAFERGSLARATRVLAEINQHDRLRDFILRLQENAEKPNEHALVVRFARSLARPDLAVASAKRSAQRGVLLVEGGFPVIDQLLAPPAPDPAAILALARQESEFNQYAVSPAGARGMMQLMPATAREVARNLQLGYEQDWLTTNLPYNAKLGSHYLNQMLNNWDGSFALALAAYNAGEGRVRKWVKDFGDPRQSSVDVVDWVESIPFTETRNYVQRVVEALQVYRHRLGGPAQLRIEADLRGGAFKHASNLQSAQ